MWFSTACLHLALFSIWIHSIKGVPARSDHGEIDWYSSEVAFLANLKSRVTGTRSHSKLIDHIESELELLGLQVRTDVFDFVFSDVARTAAQLEIEGRKIDVSSFVPYSGVTGPLGVNGTLIHLLRPGNEPPEWSKASGNIAVVNMTNFPHDLAHEFVTWPSQSPWNPEDNTPDANAEAAIANLTDAANAGVKGIIYTWEHISTGNAYGQYIPFHLDHQGIPAIFVVSDASKAVISAADDGSTANLILDGQLVPNTQTRSIWTVVEGSELKNESIIINTHTDGVNVVEENGHIAMLAKAKELQLCPPRRTTILAFVTGHMHTPAFSDTGRVTSRWLADHPYYWKGGSNQLKAIFGSCVEHMGAIHWHEDLETDSYYPTDMLEKELMFASTSGAASLVDKYWKGVTPGITRAQKPVNMTQPGEGRPFLDNGIPEISLIPAPNYLLKEWPSDFDERQLIDLHALKRQTESFLRIWREVDAM